MSSKKEKLIIENLLSSKDIFARCSGIVQSKYFEPEYRPAVSFITDYFSKYKALPSLEIVKAETDIEFTSQAITSDVIKYTCESVEKFCREQAMMNAIMDSAEELQGKDPNMGKIEALVRAAQAVSLPKDLGIEFFENPEDRLKSYIDSEVPLPTYIEALDKHLDGGPHRKTLTLFSANSGVGKSVMLANLGVNYSKQGYNVLYISLELSEQMIDLRLSSIATGTHVKHWKENIPEISHKILNLREKGAGSYRIKRMARGTKTNDIRSYIKTYELENGYLPDILIIDYLDLMAPNEGSKNQNLSDEDKKKSEELAELLFDIDAVGLSASQQNRGALDNPDPNQGVIAGGLTKVNTVDNYISLYMNPAMRLNGQMILFFLKTRSSDGVGKQEEVVFHPTTLIINDRHGTSKPVPIAIVDNKKKYPQKGGKKPPSRADEIMRDMADTTKELPPTVAAEMQGLNELPPMPPEKIEDEFGDEHESSLDALLDRLF